jgi:hypothetical protein
MSGRRRRCRPRSRLRRLMNGLRGRDALLRRCRRRLRSVGGRLRSVPCRWQAREVGWTRRMSCRCRRCRWRRHRRCRHIRRRQPAFGRCRGSGWRSSPRSALRRRRRRLRRRVRPDPLGGQMREIRCTRRMAGRGCRRGHIGGRRRCRGRRRRGLASSPGGRLHASWRRWRFLRAFRCGADARRRSELREIWPGGRRRRGRACGFGLGGCRGWRRCRR